MYNVIDIILNKYANQVKFIFIVAKHIDVNATRIFFINE